MRRTRDWRRACHDRYLSRRLRLLRHTYAGNYDPLYQFTYQRLGRDGGLIELTVADSDSHRQWLAWKARLECDNPTVCSCWMCGNPRAVRGRHRPTIQELRCRPIGAAGWSEPAGGRQIV